MSLFRHHFILLSNVIKINHSNFEYLTQFYMSNIIIMCQDSNFLNSRLVFTCQNGSLHVKNKNFDSEHIEMETESDLVSFIHKKFAAVMCLDIDDETAKRFPKVSETKAKLTKLSLDKTAVGMPRIIDWTDFNIKNEEEIAINANMIFDEIGLMFANEEFYQNFNITDKYDMINQLNLQMQPKSFKIDQMSHHTPWFKWFREFIFKETMFQSGFVTDVPFCFLYISSGQNVKLPQQIFKNLKFPHILPDFKDAAYTRFILNQCSHILIYLSDNKEELNKFHTSSAFDLVFRMHINEFTQNLSDTFQHLVLNFINTKYLKLLSTLNFDQGGKVSLFSSKPTILQRLRLATYNFQLGNYTDASKQFQAIPSNSPEYNNYLSFMKLVSSIADSKTKFSMDKFIFQDEIESTDILFNLIRFVLYLSLLETFDVDIKDIPALESKIINLTANTTEKKFKSLLKAITYEEIAIYFYRKGLFRKFVSYLYDAVVCYSKLTLVGHKIRCFSFIHQIIYKDVDFNQYFIAGSPSNNLNRLLPQQWSFIGSHSLLNIALALTQAKSYTQALEIIFVILSAKNNNRIHDEETFKILFSVFNFSHQNIIETKDINLVSIDRDKISIQCYGSLEYFDFSEDEFADIMQIRSKLIKTVRGTNAISSMWAGEKSNENNSKTIVCGEKMIIKIPIQNNRWFSLLLSDISLTDDVCETEMSSIQKIEVEKKTTKVLAFTVQPSKPGTFKITNLSFKYWNILNDIISLNSVSFTAIDSVPSMKVEFSDIPEELVVGQTVYATCKLTNFGFCPINQINIISDQVNNFNFEFPGELKDNHMITKVLNEKSLNPQESLEISAVLHVSRTGTLTVHFVFNYVGEAGTEWRFIPYRISSVVKQREKITSSIIANPTTTDKQILLTEIITGDVDIEVNQIQLIGKKVLEFNPIKVAKNSCYSLINNIVDDSESKIDQKHARFLFSRRTCGLIQAKTENDKICHFLITGVPEPEEDLRYTISAASELSFSPDMNIEIVVNIKNFGKSASSNKMFITPYQPKGTKIGTLLWYGKIRKSIPPLESGQEFKVTFIAQPLSPGIYNIGYFKICKGESKEILNLNHVIFVRI